MRPMGIAMMFLALAQFMPEPGHVCPTEGAFPRGVFQLFGSTAHCFQPGEPFFVMLPGFRRELE